MTMKLIKPLPGIAPSLKVGDVVTVAPCKFAPNAFNCFKDGQPIEWAVPKEYLEEVR